ncbi:phytanoyl-CoA dioxygenase family protein [Burkholderia sp. MSMB1835]|uniref:phytanoyl-CoA dioxygenase family protein n=1 Tax=Burkholderia sp. MSMB1835 TaxID=1637876 RepID=UPI000AAD7E05|nr:phytanoyl-CoA dioxygenase family protein [Burkholderia sp. MSMB1835]
MLIGEKSVEVDGETFRLEEVSLAPPWRRLSRVHSHSVPKNTYPKDVSLQKTHLYDLLRCKSQSNARRKMTNLRDQFVRDGYLYLPAFYTPGQVDEVARQISDVKNQRSTEIVVDMLDTGERTTLGYLSPKEIESRRMKINDLYLPMASVRELSLSERLAPILGSLLGHTPVLCNSLYLEKGSAQPPHVDALYMTPKSDEHLIASWIALEDAHPDAGQLEYFPGSHLIKQMIFSNGTRHFVPSEMPEWEAYMERQVRELGLEKKSFSAKKGDVFIWHCNLLHAGGAIRNPNLTRKSLVFHYYSLDDVKEMDYKIEQLNGAYWMNRAPQPLPEDAKWNYEFSEEAYLACNPDVADAVRSGVIASGRAHYAQYGQHEGRRMR